MNETARQDTVELRLERIFPAPREEVLDLISNQQATMSHTCFECIGDMKCWTILGLHSNQQTMLRLMTLGTAK